MIQTGEKSLYIEQSTGQITIHSPNGVQIINPQNFADLELIKEFGPQVAEILERLKITQATPPLTQLPFPKPDPYLPRQVLKKLTHDDSLVHWEGCDLLQELEQYMRIVLLGDSGMGKSTELEWICYELKESGRYVPIYKRLRNYRGNQIYLMLPINLGQEEDIILVLDGLDESDIYLTKQAIEKFTDDYPKVKIIVSCRKNVYAATLVGFKEYYMNKLSYQQIQQYLQNRLGQFSDTFLEFWQRRYPQNQTQLIDNPFYLVRICEFFGDNGNNLPNSLGEVFDHLIEKSLDLRMRKISHFDDESHRKSCRKSLEKLAFIMECRGENVISKTDLECLIDDSNEREVLLAKSSLIEFQDDSWRFSHTNFQEYLAAKVLSRGKNLENIRQVIGIKPDYKHLTWSWINTLSFLLSLLDDNNPLKGQLIEWLISSNLDALIKIGSFERDKISLTTRERIFRLAFEACKKEDIIVGYRHYNYWDLAEFGESATSIRYLTEELKKAKTSIVKTNALVLLRNMNGYSVPLNIRDELRAEMFHNIYDFENNNSTVRHFAMESLFRLFDDLSKEEAVEMVETFFDAKNAQERASIYIIIEKHRLQIKYMGRLIRRTVELDDDDWRGEVYLMDEGFYLEKCLENLSTEEEFVSFFENYPQVNENWYDDESRHLPTAFLLKKITEETLSQKGIVRIFDAMKQRFYEWIRYHRLPNKDLVSLFIENINCGLISLSTVLRIKDFKWLLLAFLMKMAWII